MTNNYNRHKTLGNSLRAVALVSAGLLGAGCSTTPEPQQTADGREIIPSVEWSYVRSYGEGGYSLPKVIEDGTSKELAKTPRTLEQLIMEGTRWDETYSMFECDNGHANLSYVLVDKKDGVQEVCQIPLCYSQEQNSLNSIYEGGGDSGVGSDSGGGSGTGVGSGPSGGRGGNVGGEAGQASQ